MLSKIKKIMTSPIGGSISKAMYGDNIYINNETSKGIRIIILKRRLKNVTYKLSKYRVKLHIAKKNTYNALMEDRKQPYASIEYLSLNSNYIGRAYDELKLTKSYESLIEERHDIYDELKKLDADHEYLNVTRDYIYHTYC
jgi:hypothetical protein